MNGHSFWQTSVHRSTGLCSPSSDIKKRRKHMYSSAPLDHVNHRQRDVAFQRDFQPFHGDITSFLEKLNASQSRSHFKAREASGAGRRFTDIQQQSANALPRPVGMNKESANFRRVSQRVKHVILALSPAITAIKRFAFAPAAAGNNHWFCP